MNNTLNSKPMNYNSTNPNNITSANNSRYTPSSTSNLNTPNNGGPSAPPSEKFVTDSHYTNSKQLLNAYIYDFLIKSSLPETAESFIKEADVPTGNPVTKTIKRPPQKDLLPLAISLDAPQGFLYEWWQIFWDVFNARTHRGGSENAQHYYQLQLARQQREIDLHNSTLHATHQQQIQLQQMNQQQLQQHQFQQLGQQGISGQSVGQFNTNQIAGQFGSSALFSGQDMTPGATAVGAMNGPGNMQQFLLQQQWLQQQQKQIAAAVAMGGGNVVPGGAQQPSAFVPGQGFIQGSPDQQAFFQQQQQQLKSDIDELNANRSAQAQVQYQMNQLRRQQLQQMQQLQHQNGRVASNNGNNDSTSPSKKQKLSEKSPLSKPQEDKDLESAKEPDTTTTNANTGSSALQDYQLQLMLLERENKKMLSNKSKEASIPNSTSNTPNSNSNAPSTNNSTKKVKKDLSSTSPLLKVKKEIGSPPSESPAIPDMSITGNAATPASTETLTTTTTTGRKKKEPAQRRSRAKKKDSNISNPPTPTTPLTPSQVINNTVKREPTTSTIMEENNEDGLIETTDLGALGNNNNNSYLTHHQQRLHQRTINPTDLSPGTAQLTPPTSDSNKNATSSTNLKEDPLLMDINNDQDHQEDDTESQNFGAAMLTNSNSHPTGLDSDNDDAFGSFGTLGDFQNDLNNENFNLENFLNNNHGADGDDVGLGDDRVVGFESYWRDSVGSND